MDKDTKSGESDTRLMNTFDKEVVRNDRREDKLQAGIKHVSGISPERVTIGGWVYINFGNMIIKIPRYFGLCVVLLIYVCCWCLARSPMFTRAPGKLSLAILGDLLFVTPVVFAMCSLSKKSRLLLLCRMFMAGLILAPLILAGYPNPLLQVLRIWIAPLIEAFLIGSIIVALRKQYRLTTQSSVIYPDFLVQCRVILFELIGHQRLARVLSGELALFYYLRAVPHAPVPGTHRFTTHRTNGSKLVLQCFLGLFIVETAGMHLLVRLWNPQVAICITFLGGYSCVQLLAHIRSLSIRETVVNHQGIFLRNGLLGGEAVLSFENINKIKITKYALKVENAARLAFIKGLEKPNVLIQLNDPVEVIKSFGRVQISKNVLVHIDQAEEFMELVCSHKSSGDILHQG